MESGLLKHQLSKFELLVSLGYPRQNVLKMFHSLHHIPLFLMLEKKAELMEAGNLPACSTEGCCKKRRRF
jgi:hypothetical protein